MAYFDVPRIHGAGEWNDRLGQRIALQENGSGVVMGDGCLVTRRTATSCHHHDQRRSRGCGGDRPVTTAASLRESVERKQYEGAKQEPLELCCEILTGNERARPRA